MSTLRVTMERLVVTPHPDADLIELAHVGGYQAVVRRGLYETGDYAIYIPEQAVLPPELIEELGLVGKLAGADRNRVKAVRLRGELSQGIVCRPDAVRTNWRAVREEIESGISHDWSGTHDYAEDLGITKWVPPVPMQLDGKVFPAPDLIRWIEIENIKRDPDMFREGEPVIATEKVHGSCCLVTVTADGAFVSSKGYGGRNLALLETPGNTYWRAVRRYGLIEYGRALREALDVPAVGIFGEIYGRGIQDLHYGSEAAVDEAIGYAMFDVAAAGSPLGMSFLPPATLVKVMLDLPLPPPPMAPVLYDGPYNYEVLRDLAEGREEVSGQSLHIREGLVVRPKHSEHRSGTGYRQIAKFISEAYVLRGGNATEYE